MKTPLFIFVTLLLVCLLSGCRKSRYFYNSDLPCGKVSGDIKKVVDTTYIVTNGEITHPLGISEYSFDSCHRLIEEQHCLYSITSTDEEVSLSIRYREVIKNRYDWNGRRVESHKKSYTCGKDSTQVTESMYLAKTDGDNEVWNVSSTNEKGEVLNTQMLRQYEKNRILTDYTGDIFPKKPRTIQQFDESGNLVECRFSDGTDMGDRTIYVYNEANQLIELFRSQDNPRELYKIVYQMDEYDNEGNWLKRTELDENNEIKSVTRRRIEYRM